MLLTNHYNHLLFCSACKYWELGYMESLSHPMATESANIKRTDK